ncbi:arylsulfatase G-like [Clavelina lepadiformis]|uniref:arylsulfatase G-like n=1 Tax=Clavelina lepadiformis TaxID=159417 RepID=UPI0040411538
MRTMTYKVTYLLITMSVLIAFPLLHMCGFVSLDPWSEVIPFFFGKSNHRPNFVVFFADDIGWGDFGANWTPNKDATPNLNQMAREGLRLTDFHAGASVCTPSRASLLTGRLGLRTGVIHNFDPESLGGLPLNETTLAEVLKGNGYTTGMIGKWHLGITEKYHPRSRGFDYYYGLPYSNDMGCVDVFTYNLPPSINCPKNTSTDAYFKAALPLYENYDIVEQPADLIQLGDHYAAKATEFVDKAAKSGKPFLLYVAFAHMHCPLSHAERFTNATSLQTVYADTLYEMDNVIGRVLKSLKTNNLYDNTLTWFTGDNGPWSEKCQYSGSQGPFSGTWQFEKYGGGSTAKATTWEAGHREPTVVVWPNKIAPNQTSSALTSNLDIFPTLLSLAGATLPNYRHFDGMDLTLLFEGKTDKAHEVLFHPNSGDTFPFGEIDTVRLGNYKVLWKTGGSFANCGGVRAPQVAHNPPIVFDLEEDPAESTPLNDSFSKLQQIITDAALAREKLLDDIKNDNTSIPDYSKSKSAVPCCDRSVFYCRCKKDEA